jgi:uncharacterized membrane protein
MRWGAVTATILAVTVPFSHALAVDDSEVLALMRKHCVICHAAKPTHESFQEAPKNIALETIADRQCKPRPCRSAIRRA